MNCKKNSEFLSTLKVMKVNNYSYNDIETIETNDINENICNNHNILQLKNIKETTNLNKLKNTKYAMNIPKPKKIISPNTLKKINPICILQKLPMKMIDDKEDCSKIINLTEQNKEEEINIQEKENKVENYQHFLSNDKYVNNKTKKIIEFNNNKKEFKNSGSDKKLIKKSNSSKKVPSKLSIRFPEKQDKIALTLDTSLIIDNNNNKKDNIIENNKINHKKVNSKSSDKLLKHCRKKVRNNSRNLINKSSNENIIVYDISIYGNNFQKKFASVNQNKHQYKKTFNIDPKNLSNTYFNKTEEKSKRNNKIKKDEKIQLSMKKLIINQSKSNEKDNNNDNYDNSYYNNNERKNNTKLNKINFSRKNFSSKILAQTLNEGPLNKTNDPGEYRKTENFETYKKRTRSLNKSVPKIRGKNQYNLIKNEVVLPKIKDNNNNNNEISNEKETINDNNNNNNNNNNQEHKDNETINKEFNITEDSSAISDKDLSISKLYQKLLPDEKNRYINTVKLLYENRNKMEFTNRIACIFKNAIKLGVKIPDKLLKKIQNKIGDSNYKIVTLCDIENKDIQYKKMFNSLKSKYTLKHPKAKRMLHDISTGYVNDLKNLQSINQVDENIIFNISIYMKTKVDVLDINSINKESKTNNENNNKSELMNLYFYNKNKNKINNKNNKEYSGYPEIKKHNPNQITIHRSCKDIKLNRCINKYLSEVILEVNEEEISKSTLQESQKKIKKNKTSNYLLSTNKQKPKQNAHLKNIERSFIKKMKNKIINIDNRKEKSEVLFERSARTKGNLIKNFMNAIVPDKSIIQKSNKQLNLSDIQISRSNNNHRQGDKNQKTPEKNYKTGTY